MLYSNSFNKFKCSASARDLGLLAFFPCSLHGFSSYAHIRLLHDRRNLPREGKSWSILIKRVKKIFATFKLLVVGENGQFEGVSRYGRVVCGNPELSVAKETQEQS